MQVARPRIRLRVARPDQQDAACCRYGITVTNEPHILFLSPAMERMDYLRTTTPWRRELDGMYSSSEPEEQQEPESSL